MYPEDTNKLWELLCKQFPTTRISMPSTPHASGKSGLPVIDEVACFQRFPFTDADFATRLATMTHEEMEAKAMLETRPPGCEIRTVAWDGDRGSGRSHYAFLQGNVTHVWNGLEWEPVK